MKLALNVVMHNNSDFVDVIVQHCFLLHCCPAATTKGFFWSLVPVLIGLKRNLYAVTCRRSVWVHSSHFIYVVNSLPPLKLFSVYIDFMPSAIKLEEHVFRNGCVDPRIYIVSKFSRMKSEGKYLSDIFPMQSGVK